MPNWVCVCVSACAILLHATIWPESETLKYHTVGPARCQGARVPRWLGCLTETFSPSGVRSSFQMKFHSDINVFIGFYTHLETTQRTVDLFLFSFKAIYSNSLEFLFAYNTTSY